MRRLLAIIVVLVVAVGILAPARADAVDCFGEDIDRRIDGCTALIEQRDQR